MRTSDDLSIAILGAGHGGQALAADLTLKGFSVNLFSFFESEIAPVTENGGIRLQGDVVGFATPKLVTTSLDRAVKGVDLIMVVTPALAHRTVASLLSACLADGQIVVLNPGRTGGALEFAQTLRRFAVTKRLYLAEAQTLIYATENRGPAHVEIMKVKNKMRVAALPARDNDVVIPTLQRLFPQIEAAQNVLETSLNNVGAIVHPAPMLLNTSRIDDAAAGADIRYYRDIITRTICEKTMEKMDAERVAVARCLGLDAWTCIDWYRESYDVTGDSLYDVLQKNEYYLGFHAPTHFLGYHHVLDEIPNSLVPISSFGAAFGVPTPTINAIVDLGISMTGIDFWREGRTVQTLGLDGMSLEQMLRTVEIGG